MNLSSTIYLVDTYCYAVVQWPGYCQVSRLTKKILINATKQSPGPLTAITYFPGRAIEDHGSV